MDQLQAKGHVSSVASQNEISMGNQHMTNEGIQYVKEMKHVKHWWQLLCSLFYFSPFRRNPGCDTYHMKYNLLSISQFCKSGYIISFNKDIYIVKNKDDNILFTAKRHEICIGLILMR
ncbi:hypothetical protein CR513_29313, partial [Mucuna pruriens]